MDSDTPQLGTPTIVYGPYEPIGRGNFQALFCRNRRMAFDRTLATLLYRKYPAQQLIEVEE